MDGPSDVARDVVIGALEFARLTLGVVREGHSQGADVEAIQQLGKSDMTLRTGIPLRQYDERAALALFRWKPLAVHRVVFGVGGAHGTGESQVTLVEAKVTRAFVGEKPVGIGEGGGD